MSYLRWTLSPEVVLNIQIDRALIPAGSVVERYLTIAITAPRAARDARVIIGGRNDIEVDCLNDFVTRFETVTPTLEGEAHVCLGNLAEGHRATVLIAVRCPARALGESAIITVRLSDRDTVFFARPMPIEWRAVCKEDYAAQPTNNSVRVQAAQLIASRALKPA